MRDGYTFDKSTLAVLVNLAQRVRRLRREIRELKRVNCPEPHRRLIEDRYIEEAAVWNAYQAAKKTAIDYAMKREEESAEACLVCEGPALGSPTGFCSQECHQQWEKTRCTVDVSSYKDVEGPVVARGAILRKRDGSLYFEDEEAR